MKRNLRLYKLLFFMTLGLLLVPTLAWACPMCKEAIAFGPTAISFRIAQGYFWSILFMMSAPYVLASVLAGVIYTASKKSKNKPT